MNKIQEKIEKYAEDYSDLCREIDLARFNNDFKLASYLEEKKRELMRENEYLASAEEQAFYNSGGFLYGIM